MTRKAFGPQLPVRGTRLTHKGYGPVVVTSVRRDYYGPVIYFTTAELWDTYGVKSRTSGWSLRAFARNLA